MYNDVDKKYNHVNGTYLFFSGDCDTMIPTNGYLCHGWQAFHSRKYGPIIITMVT